MSKRSLPKVEMGARPGVQSDLSPRALQRWSPDVRAADAGGDASISILDPIGADMWGDGVTARRIAAALRSIGDQPVTVNINSPGGDYFEGLAIYNLLREHGQEVTVNVLGIAASAASIIAMAGDQVRVARAGWLMIHNTWILAAGDRNALREVADWLGPFDDMAVDIYASRTGLEPASLAAMLDRETWIGGQGAVDQGFADALLPADLIDQSSEEGATASMRAERKFDLLARRAGLSNSASRDLLRALKSGKPGAAQDGPPGAAAIAQELESLLHHAKSL